MRKDEELDGGLLRAAALSGGEPAREAFLRLWSAYRRRLLVFAAGFHGLPRDELEDFVTEALIGAFTHLGSYDPSRPLSAWVYVVARNSFLDARARLRRYGTVAAELAPDLCRGEEPGAALGPEGEMETRDLAERCRSAIARLPGRDRQIAQLRFYEELDAREIGEILDLPAGTVRWRIHCIRKRIAENVGVER